jgi:serine phosphatase RsbU (regulator of sigma subunit)/anti-sigma regulatory factor (Ser/Thr protein kinase)
MATDGPDRPEAGQALAELQRVMDTALAHLSLDALLPELLDRIRDALHADSAAILLDDHGTLRQRAAIGLEEGAGHEGTRFDSRIVSERTPLSADDDEVDPALQEHGMRSVIGVPLLVEDRVLGVLRVGTLTPRSFSELHRELLQFAAERAARAIENAQLYEQERLARAEAERSAQTVRALQRVTDAALAYLSIDELLSELLIRIREILRADTAAILLLNPAGDTLVARAAKGIEEEVEQGVRIPLGEGFAGRVAAERRPVTVFDIDEFQVINPILREKGIRSLLGVPLLVEGRVLGVLHVGTLTFRRFEAADEDLLQRAADRAALAIEHAQLYEHRRLAEALQRSLLPESLPAVPGIELAARYLPAAAAANLGGDWYDVFRLSGGMIGVVIGDVVGRGLAAAALMAQLRTALRAYAFDGHPPGAVVGRLNRLTGHLSASTMTTLSYVVVDPAAHSATIVSAGHLPPLVIGPDGRASYLPVESDVALGVARSARYREQSFELPEGATLALFTDGAVEVRGEPLEAGLERLRRIAEEPDTVEELCDRLAGGALHDGEPSDDVAVLVAQLLPLGDRLETRWPADPEALADVRHLLRRWLQRQGADPDETYDITVACQEACANAVEHAYAPGPAGFELEAERAEGAIYLTVRDRGHWRDARGTHRGRGLPIMEALMDTVDIHHSPAGTAVRMCRALGARTTA